MGNAGIACQSVFGKKTYDLACGSTGLRDRLRNILRPLTCSREKHSCRRTFNRAKLRMRFGEEIIGIHACSKHSCKLPCGFIRFHCRSKHNHIRIDMQLFPRNQIRCLNLQLVPLRRNLAYHAFNIVHAVLLNGTTVKLIKNLSRGAHINVENINIRIRIFIPCEHRMFCCVHAADFRTIFLALIRTGRTARTDALNKNNGFGMFTVARAKQRALGRPRSIHKPFEFKRRYNILGLRICKLIKLFE